MYRVVWDSLAPEYSQSLVAQNINLSLDRRLRRW